MPKGSPRVVLRLSPGLLAAIEAEIRTAETAKSGGQWTVSSYIRTAIADKLLHAERSRRAKRHDPASIDATLPDCGRR
jgi:hypothetical protein